MAKKKRKLTKKQRQKLRSLALPLITLMLGLLVGIQMTKIIGTSKTPSNLVWAADNTVKVPVSLTDYLLTKDDCKHYKGSGSPKGLGLWAVYQVSGDTFAKIAYGCSWNLSSYIMAVKLGKSWTLLPPTEYFAPFNEGNDPRTGALPQCSILEKYKIPKSIESFCINADGSAKNNQN